MKSVLGLCHIGELYQTLPPLLIGTLLIIVFLLPLVLSAKLPYYDLFVIHFAYRLSNFHSFT